MQEDAIKQDQNVIVIDDLMATGKDIIILNNFFIWFNCE